MYPLTKVSIIMMILFASLTLIFLIFKGKATVLISGFNHFSKEQRKTYDTHKLALDMAKIMGLLSFIFLVTTFFVQYLTSWFFLIAIFITLIVLFKMISFFYKDNYQKYKL